MTRLSQKQLHEFFISDLKTHVVSIEEPYDKKPLIINLDTYPRNIKAYLFNCTCPPGGRTPDEYKIQLILENQKRSERCHIDESDGRTVLLIGYAVPLVDDNDGVYIIWDTEMHRDAAYSANLQVSLPHILKAVSQGVHVYEKQGNNERMVLCNRKHLIEAIHKRKDWDNEVI